MSKRTLILAMLITAIIYGCSQQEYEKTDSGIRYKFVKSGDGPVPEDGDVILMNVSYINENGSVLFTSGDSGQGPIPMSFTDSLFSRKGGIEEGIRMMKEGDSLVLKFPIEDLFENTFNMALPDSLERGSDITVCMGASRIFTIEEFRAYRAEESYKQQEVQFELDKQLLQDHFDQENIETEVHPSGLRYRILKQGTGPTAQNGQTVHVNYTGRLLNGEIFDTSDAEVAKEEGIYNVRREPYEPYGFELGTGNVIQGWDIGIGLLNEGAKAELYIPSKLAYGTRSAGPSIPPNSILVFDVELVKIGE